MGTDPVDNIHRFHVANVALAHAIYCVNQSLISCTCNSREEY